MNTYTDNPEYKFHLLNNDLIARIVELREKCFSEANEFDYAPVDLEDALDSYDKVLEVVGDINVNVLSQNADAVDQEGPHCEDGRVRYAAKTIENLDTTVKAGLCGLTMPRKYGGLNMPFSVYTLVNEIISSGDAGFENIWSLQDCIETIYCYGSEEQRQKYIPLVCNGATMSMDLTEPDAGSDLQSVMLKATYSEKDECWFLNGVKRFITNGDSDLHLVLARSEEGTTDGRGLSMFIYDNRENKRNNGKQLTVRRIENKLGIHGSPTCELVFRNAKAEIVGDRKLGLIRYVMSLMNGARLGIAAQSVGLQQAAWEEALAYAKNRRQYGKTIILFPAVYEMIARMKAKLDAGRALLYECAKYVDMYKILEYTSHERQLTPDERKEQKTYSRLADAFTPLAKGINSEFANQSTYDAIQIHGGSGYMQEYRCQRLYRDARITSIYEGTTQLQVVAAMRYITNGTYINLMKESLCDEPQIQKMISTLETSIERVKTFENQDMLDICGRYLYEMTAYTVMSQIFYRDNKKNPELFHKSYQVFLNIAQSEVIRNATFISLINSDTLVHYNTSPLKQ